MSSPSMARERVLDEWIAALRIMHIAHHQAASLFSAYNLALGVTLVLVSATLGATAYGTLHGTVAPWIVGLLGLAATILAGIQTLLGADARSKAHHAAAAAFGEARRDLEELRAFSSLDDCEQRLRDIRSRWSQALKAAPNLPARIHDPVQRLLGASPAGSLNASIAQPSSGLAIAGADLLSLWQYFEKRGAETKSTMLQVVALLIGFAAALLGYGVDRALDFSGGASVAQPMLLLAVAAAGIAVCAYADIVIRDFGEHINRNFARADAVRTGNPAALDQVLHLDTGDPANTQPLPGLCITVRWITRAFGVIFMAGAVLALHVTVG